MNRSVVDLTLKVDDVFDGTEDDRVATSLAPRSLFDSPELLGEIVSCIVNLDERIAVVTSARRTRRDDLARMVRTRLDRFKRQTLQSVPQLVNHWAVAAFEDNICQFLS